MSVVYCPICIDCVHIDLKKEKNGRPVCKAYPEGIPYDVWKEKSKPNIEKDVPCNNEYKFKHNWRENNMRNLTPREIEITEKMNSLDENSVEYKELQNELIEIDKQISGDSEILY